MKIVLITQNWPYPPISGESVIVYNLLKFLAERHEFHLIALMDEVSEEVHPIEQLASAERLYCPRRKSLLGYLTNIWRPYPYGIYAGTHYDIGVKINELVRKLKPDLVQFCSLGLSLYEPFVPPEFPRVLLAADSLSMVMERLALNERNLPRRLHYKLNRRRASALESKVYPRFNAVVLVSDVDAQVVKSHSPRSKVYVINNGVDVEYFSRSREELGNNLGIVGNFGYVPNEMAALRLLKDILPRVKDRYPNIKAYAIGINPTEEMCTLGRKDDAIIITGYVEDVRPYLEELGVFVAFLESGGGIKNKILEAMSMELPVVGTYIAFEGIKGNNKEHFVQVDNIEHAVKEIDFLFSNKPKMRLIGQKARDLVVNYYSWKEKVKEYESVWSQLVLHKNNKYLHA